MSLNGKYLLKIFLLGVVYSWLLLVTGARYLHFLVPVSLVHSLYYGTAFVGVALVFSWLFNDVSDPWIIGIISGFWGLHYFGWLYGFSFFTRTSGFVSGLLALVGASLVASLLYFGFRQGPGEETASWIPALLLVVFLGLKIAIGYLPGSTVAMTVNLKPSRSPLAGTLQQYIYPGGDPLEEFISRYGVLTNGVKQGEKVFVLVIDAFREDYFGKRLNGIQLTPNLKTLAEENFYFSEYRVQAPRSKASVASLFTGRYLREHGTYDFGPVDSLTGDTAPGPGEGGVEDYFGHALPDKFETLAERLEDEGFSNAGFTAIGHLSSRYNYDQGFQEYRMARGQGIPQDLNLLRGMLFWLLREESGDAFVYLHFHGAHFPYYQGKQNTRFWKQTPYFRDGEIRFDWGLEPLKDLVQRPHPEIPIEEHPGEMQFLKHLYGSALHYYDLFVLPKVLDSLRVLKAYRDSMVVVTSDHGENLFDDGNFYGHGYSLGDYTINVPLVVKMPKTNRHRYHSRLNLEGIDLTATVLDYAGGSREAISGDSFLTFLESRSDTENPAVFSEAFSERPGRGEIQSSAIAKKDCKYIYDYQKSSGGYEGTCSKRNQPPLDQDSLQERIFDRLGTDGTFRDTSATYVGIPEKEARDLEGLGYF